MVKFSYSYNKKHDAAKTARSIGRELMISPKDTTEICREIRGKTLDDALDYLERVLDGIDTVPFKRYHKKLAHKKSQSGWHSGKRPVKACEVVLEVLENARSNARYKGLEESSLFVRHASARRGFIIRGFRHRARGRVLSFDKPTTNVEIWLGEK